MCSIKSLTVSQGDRPNTVLEDSDAAITCVVENRGNGDEVEGMIEDSIGE